jgi:hypothetical protein
MRWDDLETLLRTLDLRETEDRSQRPPRDHVRAVQDALARGLADEEFRLDCIERELDGIARGDLDEPFLPMVTLPGVGIVVRMMYWAPGDAPPPHEHTTWTVTAVFHNALEVTTFDYDLARKERRLERKNNFSAVAGRVGHIFEPCIHRPANTSEDYSTSIHVFHRLDGPRLASGADGLPQLRIPRKQRPVSPEFLHVSRQERYQANLLALVPFRSSRARGVLERIADTGDAVTREVATTAREMMSG